MRIIKEKTLYDYCRLAKYKKASESIRSWAYEVKYSSWSNGAELKLKYRHASIINSKRVVFNIRGNDYRLVVDIEYRLKIVFVIWFGTHNEYDKLDVNSITYEN